MTTLPPLSPVARRSPSWLNSTHEIMSAKNTQIQFSSPQLERFIPAIGVRKEKTDCAPRPVQTPYTYDHMCSAPDSYIAWLYLSQVLSLQERHSSTTFLHGGAKLKSD